MGRRFLARTLSQRDAKRVRADAGVRKSAAGYHPVDHYNFSIILRQFHLGHRFARLRRKSSTSFALHAWS